MEFKIGRLQITIGKKAEKLTPGKTIVSTYGFSIIWLTDSSLTYIRDGYCGNPDVYTAVQKVAKTSAYAPWKVYRIKDKAKHLKYKMWTGENATQESVMAALKIKAFAYEEDNDHPLNKLLEKPNRWQGAREFTESSVGFKVLTGERMLHVVTIPAGANQGIPYEVYNLPTQIVSVEGDGTLMGVSWFILNLGQPTRIPASEIIFSREWNPNFTSSANHLRGLSPFTAGSKLVTISTSGLSRTAAMLQNAGAAGLVFDKTEGQRMTLEQGSLLKEKMVTEVLNPDNANGIAVANGDLGYINFGLKGSEMELQALMKMNRNRIASLINVPPVLLDPDNSSYNNLKEAKKELITSACFPQLDSLRSDWNEIAKLYKEQDLWVDYDATCFPEISEDTEKMMRIAKDSWWMTPNEKRLMMYMDEDGSNELMNKYIIPNGMMVIDDLGESEIDQALNSSLNESGERDEEVATD